MVLPMPKLMRDGKSPPPRRTTAVDGDDRLVTRAKNQGLAAIERSISDIRSEVIRDRLDIDVTRVGDTEFT
jgi:hypothetical protein